MFNLKTKFSHNLITVFTLVGVGLSLTGCQSVYQTRSVPKISNIQTKSSTQMMAHLMAFEKIAQENGGNRAVGTKGGQASAQYIINEVKKMGLTAQMLPFENREKQVGQNIIVELRGQSKDTAIIIGAHYDSVEQGPGINDNASGVAVVLDLIQYYQQQSIKPQQTLYFAFWDSEEKGIAGSDHFVKNLTEQQLKNIKAYINVDMVGTTNPEIMIVDADKSSIDEMEKMLIESGMPAEDYQSLTDGLRQVPTHPKDILLENRLKQFFKAKDKDVREDVSTLVSSDTAPFLGKVPVASIILFNEQMKGDILEFAPCYHQACDTLQHIDASSLELSKASVIDLIQYLDNL